MPPAPTPPTTKEAKDRSSELKNNKKVFAKKEKESICTEVKSSRVGMEG